MRAPFAISVTWTTAFAIVASLYLPTLLGLPSSVSTPLMAGVIATGLIILALSEFPNFPIVPAVWPIRGLSVPCLALALAGFAISAAVGCFDRTYSLNDWGVFGLQAGTPILLALNGRRIQLLIALSWICVAFATTDLAINCWSALQGAWQRDPGLSGNTHAAGLVAFTAVAFLATRKGGWWRWALIFALLGSLYLIDARRYLGMAVVAVPILAFRPASRLPLIFVAMAAAAIGLYGTFATGALSFGDNLRASLMETGVDDALSHPLLGSGPMWRDASGLEATYQSLAGAGVTESGILDLSITYGIVATALFMLAAVFALVASRPKLTLPAVILAMLTAELAFGDSLTGFLGAILFFTSLTICQRDELRLLATA
jgi:hypothetical protein